MQKAEKKPSTAKELVTLHKLSTRARPCFAFVTVPERSSTKNIVLSIFSLHACALCVTAVHSMYFTNRFPHFLILNFFPISCPIIQLFNYSIIRVKFHWKVSFGTAQTNQAVPGDKSYDTRQMAPQTWWSKAPFNIQLVAGLFCVVFSFVKLNFF